MKLLPLLAGALLVSACKPSEWFGPDSRNDELAGGVTAPDSDAESGIYPPGTWEDGLGNTWNVTITGKNLVGDAGSESIRGLQMAGTIQGRTLVYSIGFPGQPSIAHGAAHLTDSDHAQFETLNTDETLNAHGLLHFNHSAQVPTGQPMDLRPQTDCAGQGIQGD
jgi:hypothetical protein